MSVRRQSALRVVVADLRRRLGSQRDLHVSETMPDLEVTGAGVPADHPLVADITLESIEGAVVATGTLEVPWTAECRRCLEPITGSYQLELTERFEPHPSDDESYPIDGDEIDLEPMLRDAALLALPLAPLCRPDCAGPAPDAFPTSTVTEPGATSPDGDDEDAPRDPRWAALDQLRLDD